MTTTDSTQRDQHWAPRTRELLDQHAERLDPVRARQLLQIRQRALASVRRPRVKQWAFGLSATMAASLLLVVLMNPKPDHSVEPPSAITAPMQTTIAPIKKALTLPAADLELIASPDEYALLQDLEFFAWLEGSERGG